MMAPSRQFLGLGLWLGSQLLTSPGLGAPDAESQVKEVPAPSASASVSPAQPKPESASPHGASPTAMPGALPEDVVAPDPSIAARSIEVTTVDPQNHVLPNIPVLLVRDRQSIAEGNSSSVSTRTSDRDGKVLFTDVPVGSDSQYRLLTQASEAKYGTPPFAVDGRTGMKAVLHVYPQVRNIREALVAGRSFLFVEPRDEVLHVEVFTEWHNLGASVWLPENVELQLPAGWKAFSTNPSDPDLRIEKTDAGVKMLGTVTPGQHSTSFSFQLPSNNRVEVATEIPLWPNTAEAQVATISRSMLEMEVDGYPAAQVMQSNGQKPMLVTGRSYAKDTGGPPSDVRVTLRGLPVVSDGRWVAALAAAALVLGGLGLTWRSRRRVNPPGAKHPPKRAPGAMAEPGLGLEAEREARERLLEELVGLTRAHRSGEIGNETYEQARQTLLAACVRLERQLTTE